MGDPVSLLWGAQAPLQLKDALIMKLWCSADPYSLHTLFQCAHSLLQSQICSWCMYECECSCLHVSIVTPFTIKSPLSDCLVMSKM